MLRLKIVYLFLIVSFLGFLDAAYLTVKHYQEQTPPCSIVVGCEVVTTSRYALMFNIPVALLGAVYYLVIFILGLAYSDTKNLDWLSWLVALTPFGFIASLWFMYLQYFVIKAICLYCIGSALSSTLLFILGLITIKIIRDHPILRWWNKLRNLVR